MPELPETETIARGVDRALRGTAVQGVTVARPDVLRGVSPRAFVRALTGAVIQRVWRRAKSVVLDVPDGHHLVVTPRFTGALLIEPVWPDPAADYTAIAFRLTDGRTLRYRDVRRLGTVAWMDARAFLHWHQALGPEPLDPAFTDDAFAVILRASRQPVKTLLMDQRRLAGVGNIYANESLWRAGIRPTRAAGRVTRAEAARLLTELRHLLSASITAGGTTFRDYRNALGERGTFAAQLQAYGRGGSPCARCGTTLRTHQHLAGRTSVYCPRCQR